MTERKLPTPLYAAAGAGDAVVEQLKKIPGKVEELRDRAKVEERFASVRDNVKSGVEQLKNLDGDTVRKTASETAASLGERAKEAREKATVAYTEFVERGERVAAGERSPIKVIATITGRGDESPLDAELVDEKKNGSKPDAKKNGTPKKSGTTTKKQTAKNGS